MLLVGVNSYGKDIITYDIDATFDFSSKSLKIVQKSTLKNVFKNNGDTLYFTDWSNAYSTIESPLAQRLVEEYDRSFYLSKKSKLGKTSINSFRLNQKEVNWSRLKNQPDIIRVVLPDGYDENQLNFEIHYQVTIPDAKFTGYGYNNKGDVYLRYWHIAISPRFDNNWRNYSNLDLEDFSIQPAIYKLKLTLPEEFKVECNLKKEKNEGLIHHFYGNQYRDISLFLTKNNDFNTYKTVDDRVIVTDIFKNVKKEEGNLSKVERIDAFVTKTLNYSGIDKFLIPELIYQKNPFFGINDLPKFISPFNELFLEEISFLKSYLHFYLSNNLSIDLRKDHWIIGGLQTYLIIKYIETYYPQQKYLGRVGDFKIMKAYTLADIKFNESFWMYYEFMERANLQQSDFLPKDQLIKFNEKIGSPYHVGVGLRYLEHYIGENSIMSAIQEYFNQSDQNLNWMALLKKHSTKNIDWFENFYLGKRLPIDIKIKNIKKKKDSITVNISKYSDHKIPFVLSQLKDGNIISQQWIENAVKTSTITLANLKADFVAINPEIRLPESNKTNNWRNVNNFLNLKPIQFNFLKDYESPKRIQIYYNPVANYNLYDGLSLGSRFYDKGILTQKFIFDLMPQYSYLENDLVGQVKMSLRINNGNKSNYVTFLNFFASSYHYSESLRYQVITPSINFYFRTEDYRSNERHALGLYYYSVNRDSPPFPISTPNYNLLNLRYLYSNRGALKHTTLESNIEFSKHFSKMEFTFDFRQLFPNGSQFTARFFAGKFLQYNIKDTNFFDFNLNHPQDYLFRYNYLGRSEIDGFFSQQIIMGEGGFKSNLYPATANDYLLSTNLTLGIWKWIEGYVDLGILKNHNANPYYLYGSGIRLNILPDYLELFFPLHNNDGWEIDNTPYETKIRFVLKMSPRELSKLFSRKWF